MFHHLSWIDDHVLRMSPYPVEGGQDSEAEEAKESLDFSLLDCPAHRAHTVECCQRLSRKLRRLQSSSSLFIRSTEWYQLGCVEGERLRPSPLREVNCSGVRPSSLSLSPSPSPPLPFSPPFFAFSASAFDLWKSSVACQRLNSYEALRLYLLDTRQALEGLSGEEEVWGLSLPPSASPLALQRFASQLSGYLHLELFYAAVRLDQSAAANENEEEEAERWAERMAKAETPQWHHFTPSTGPTSGTLRCRPLVG